MVKKKRIRRFVLWAKVGIFLSGFISACAVFPAMYGYVFSAMVMVILGNLSAGFAAVAYGKSVRAEFGE